MRISCHRRPVARLYVAGVVLLTTLLGLAGALPAQGAAKKDAANAVEQARKGAEEPRVYDVTEVMPRSERASAYLRELRDKLDADKSLDTIEAALPAFAQQTDEWWTAEKPTLLAGRSVQRISDFSWELSTRAAQVEAWKLLLTNSSKAWITDEQQLARRLANWRATRAALSEDAPVLVRERIDEVLKAIDETHAKLRADTARLVAAQARLGAQSEAIVAIRRELDALRASTSRDLLTHDAPPLVTVLANREARPSLADQIEDGAGRLYRDAGRLVDIAKLHAVLHLCAFFSMWVLFFAFGRMARHEAAVKPTPAERVVLDQGLASALLLAMALVPVLYPDANPQTVRLALVPSLVPILLLAPAILSYRLRIGFYFFCGIMLLDSLRNYVPSQWALGRLMLLATACLGVGGCIALAWHARRSADTKPKQVEKVLLAGGALFFGASVVANFFGNISLAEYLVSPVIRLLFLGVAIRLAVVVATTFAVMALRSPVAQWSRVILERGDSVALTLRRLLAAVGVIGWAYLAAFNLGMLDTLRSALLAFMTTEWQVGAAVISVRDVTTFFLVFFAAFLLSRALRLILAEEIFPRIHFPRGVPDALVLIARYGVLLFGFLLALTSAGVDLSQVTIALSALGVGIGFGLQSVVNNFVSGLILVFEHPIQVGDYIEVGPHYGKVSRIGFRASVLVTRDGSDVVIPNAELIGHRVVNWSLSDAIRRLNVPVSVAMDSDASRVIALLTQLARDCPKVNDTPPPSASLSEFGEGSLKFVLRCWVRAEDMGAARDQLTLAIDSTFRKAGIVMPFPQADVHLHLPGKQTVRFDAESAPGGTPSHS